jgi:hypothetical protein
MDVKDLPFEEFTLAEGVIISLSQLSKEQFHELMSSGHPEAKKFRKYSLKEFEYHKKSRLALTTFFKRDISDT